MQIPPLLFGFSTCDHIDRFSMFKKYNSQYYYSVAQLFFIFPHCSKVLPLSIRRIHNFDPASQCPPLFQIQKYTPFASPHLTSPIQSSRFLSTAPSSHFSLLLIQHAPPLNLMAGSQAEFTSIILLFLSIHLRMNVMPFSRGTAKSCSEGGRWMSLMKMIRWLI